MEEIAEDGRAAFINAFSKKWPYWRDVIEKHIDEVANGDYNSITHPWYFGIFRVGKEIYAHVIQNHKYIAYKWSLGMEAPE